MAPESPTPGIPEPVPPLDGVTEARLLRGAPRDDIPASYHRVADVVAALTAPPTSAERAGEAATAAAFVVARHAARELRLVHPPRRTPVLARLSTCVALVLASAGSLAATAGALPTPLQAAAHHLFAPIGVPVPAPSSTPANSSSPGDGVTPPVHTPTGENGTG